MLRESSGSHHPQSLPDQSGLPANEFRDIGFRKTCLTDIKLRAPNFALLYPCFLSIDFLSLALLLVFEVYHI